MKIYTKTGDKGITSLIGGERVKKNHIRLDAYGTIDELIAFSGLLRDQPIDEHCKNILIIIQGNLMSIAAFFAMQDENVPAKIPPLVEADIQFLENEIDSMELSLDPLKSFILPGGHPVVSICHICRTICRRAEREAYRLSDSYNINTEALKYLNRLSDFFFVFSRKLGKDYKAGEIPWNKNL